MRLDLADPLGLAKKAPHRRLSAGDQGPCRTQWSDHCLHCATRMVIQLPPHYRLSRRLVMEWSSRSMKFGLRSVPPAEPALQLLRLADVRMSRQDPSFLRLIDQSPRALSQQPHSQQLQESQEALPVAVLRRQFRQPAPLRPCPPRSVPAWVV